MTALGLSQPLQYQQTAPNDPVHPFFRAQPKANTQAWLLPKRSTSTSPAHLPRGKTFGSWRRRRRWDERARRQTRKCYFYNDGSKFPPRNEPNRNDTMAVPAELEGSLHNASIAIFGTGDLQRSRPCDNAKQGSLEFTDVRTQTSFPALQISYGNAGVMEYLLGVVAVGAEIRIC